VTPANSNTEINRQRVLPAVPVSAGYGFLGEFIVNPSEIK
jgi:hypothetical protein